MKENQLEKQAQDASDAMRKKLSSNVTLPKGRQTAAHDKITMSETDGLLLVSSQPGDLEDLANIDIGEWTVTNEHVRVSISEVQKNAVTLPQRDDSFDGNEFEIGIGGCADDFNLMDGAVAFDNELGDSGGFQIDESQNQQNESGDGMIDFALYVLSRFRPLSIRPLPDRCA